MLDTSRSQPLNHGVSVMRDFLESHHQFKWPQNIGKCSGNHCDISREQGRIPLKWIQKISDKANASIDTYEAGPDFRFQKTFVVKTIRDPDTRKAQRMTKNEVDNMRDLRHPHVTALLATFSYQARLSILIFPAACGDLHQFMKQLSRTFGKDRVALHADSTVTVDNDTTTSRYHVDSNVDFTSKHKEHDRQDVTSERWPLMIPTDEMPKMLRRYFVCLSQALNYLHGSGVRHKDIKPENILIDESGSVLLTDFGISRRFPKHTPHATNNEWKFTRKYASPEIMKDRHTIRDDPSDVFSLGCVFLEMATLLLGKNLDSLSDYYATIINESSKEEAYHCNLGKVYAWIDTLRDSGELKIAQQHRLSGDMDKPKNFQSNTDSHITAALKDIREMLDENPLNRPESRELWQRFQYISPIKCRDCDPRRPDVWKPSARQQKDAETGLNKRLSLQSIEEANFMSKGLSLFGDIDSTMLLGQHILNRSLGRSARGSSPSASEQSYSNRSHIRATSETELPELRLNGDVSEGAGNVRSQLSRLHTAQKPETVFQETSPDIIQAPEVTPPAKAMSRVSTDERRQNLDQVGSTRSPQLARPPATQLDLDGRTAVRQEQQSRVPNRTRAISRKGHASENDEFTPHPQTRIIVYDVFQIRAFEDVFSSLQGECRSPS